ncbi:MAG TPA: hypothetical protein VLX29_10940 [Nitrospirota bacterium]|nr:hypothetical protein [Nitrospirota bacterium]
MVIIASEGLVLEILKDLLKITCTYLSFQVTRFIGSLYLIHFALKSLAKRGILGLVEIIFITANSKKTANKTIIVKRMIFPNRYFFCVIMSKYIVEAGSSHFFRIVDVVAGVMFPPSASPAPCRQ